MTRVSEKRGREAKASKERGEVYMGGQGAHVGAKRAKYAKNKNNIYRVRNVPKYKRATQGQISVEPKAKDSRTVFGFKFWPHPGG